MKSFSENITTSRANHSDAGIQTDSILTVDQTCQTIDSSRKDFQSQATIESKKESTAIQTYSFERQDFQVQAYLQRACQSIAIQTIKEETETPNIRMPNTPNSVGQTQPKKRKLSTKPGADTSITTGTQCSDIELVVDAVILNSEVYKIYCRNQDPKEAMKQIKKLKTCVLFEEPKYSLPKEDDLKYGFDSAVENLSWSFYISKWETIQRCLEERSYGIFHEEVPLNINGVMYDYDLDDIFEHCFTRIEILLPNGFEFWLIKNFEYGAGVSKWYRGVSNTISNNRFGEPNAQYAEYMAKFNAIGVTNTMIERYHHEDILKENAQKVPWLDFAERILQHKKRYLFPEGVRMEDVTIAVKQVKKNTTIEFTATLLLTCSDDDGEIQTYKTYYGKSTRPIKSSKTRRPKNEKEEMTKEARKAALIECFKDRFGFTEFSDITVDDFHRPITA